MTTFLLALVLTAGAGKAVNVSRYEGVTINNPTDVEVRYQLKWGDGEYKSFTLRPAFTLA